MRINKLKQISGSITPALLLVSSAFIIVIYGILFALSLQFDYSQRQTASESALAIAEAGINYYKWHLAHDPLDYTDGTGQPGPYIHNYSDPQGEEIGQYSLEIEAPENGSSVVTIRSTGWTNDEPRITRTIEARYGQPSFSRFSFLSNASSWYGENITVNGQIHSNNGIRMDGTNLSLVTSAQETYMCGTETGCFPPDNRPGVWGSGGDQGLWQFPIPSVDFDSISFDFANMRDAAQNIGVYLPSAGVRGYHLVFQSDGSVRISRVTRTGSINGYAVPGTGLGQDGLGGCRARDQLIVNETLVGVYDLDEIPIIFSENHLWVEGIIRGRVTVVAAKFPIVSSYANVWIPNSITYTNYDGSDALGLISQNDIYFTKNVPTNFIVDAVLIAQQGRIIRHGYFSWCGGSSGAVKDSLTINGSVISYDKSYWNFGSAPDSGFITREINYDSNALFNPPPYFPTSGDFEFISWIEK